MRAHLLTLLKIVILLVGGGLLLSIRLASPPCTRVVVLDEDQSHNETPKVPAKDNAQSTPSRLKDTLIPPDSTKQADGQRQIYLPDDIPLLRHSKTHWIPEKFFTAPRFCNDYKHNFAIANEHLCEGHDVLLVIGVRSHAKGYDSRALIRRTWGSLKEYKGMKIITLFIMGISKHTSYQESILEENKINKDIVQADFIDSYQNLTIKSQATFKWMRDYCRHAQYFMMTDTDIFVDTYKLVNYLTSIQASSDDTYVLCKVEWTEKPFRPPRFGGHFAMPYEEYESEHYATYCWGGAYVATIPLINKLYIASLHTPRLRIDDVWTGILAEKAGIKFPPTTDAYILPWHKDRFQFLRHKKYFDGPIMFAAWHGYGVNTQISNMWKRVQRHHRKRRHI